MMKGKIQYGFVSGMVASMFLCFALEANEDDTQEEASFTETPDRVMQESDQDGENVLLQGCEQNGAPDCSIDRCEPCLDVCSPATCSPTTSCANFRFSIRAGAFYPTRSCFRKTFGHASAFYGAEAAYSFCGCATLFINGDYYGRSGRPRCAISKSRINLWTGSIGVCFPLKICSCIEPYVGIGALVGGARFHDRFECDYCDYAEESRCSKTAFGGVLKSGVIIPLSSCWFGELFCDYTYLPIHLERKVNLGGGKFGGGIGVRF